MVQFIILILYSHAVLLCRDGPIPHFKRRDWQICDDEVKKWQELDRGAGGSSSSSSSSNYRNRGIGTAAVAMAPGDVLLFSSKIPHGTATNDSAEHRWALQFHYVRKGLQQGDSEEIRLGAFGGEGKAVTC